MNEIVVR